ncbi:MAG: hypothetical protein NZO58_07070 [Gemmataceae bacterium]|nr:hypothetical protein [Gemmataceae bacterium]
MKKIYAWLLTMGTTCGVVAAAHAQSNEGLFPRLRSWFAPKTADTATSKSDPVQLPRTGSTASPKNQAATVREGTGVMYVDGAKTPLGNAKVQPAGANSGAAAPSNPPVAPTNTPPSPSPALAQKLTQKISQACPRARGVRVTFNGANEVTVEMTVNNIEDCNTIAQQIFTVRELDPYRLNLKFQVP